jgi:hypothetical protein
MFTIFYVVTCNYHEYCYEQQQEQSYDEGDVEELRERLSFVEYWSAERGVKRGILRNRTSGVLLRMCVPQSGSPAAGSGKGATSSIVTADVDIPDKVLEKRIHLAEVRAKKSKAFLLRGFLGISRAARAARRSGRRRTARSGSAAGTCDRVVKVSFGRVECREFARTVGDNEVVGPIPLSLDWEVLSVMVASVDQQVRDFRVRKSRKEDFLPSTLKNGLLCWKSAA